MKLQVTSVVILALIAGSNAVYGDQQRMAPGAGVQNDGIAGSSSTTIALEVLEGNDY